MTDTRKPFIDYSQFKEFSTCELKWYEKYIAQTRRAPSGRQRDDAMTLGTLVHGALEHLRLKGTPEVPPEVIAEAGPTPECLAAARQLAHGYAMTYPVEPFEAQRCEHAIRFPLLRDIDGLAKIDRYFQIKDQLLLETGLGDKFALQPGWWIHEYKTKSMSKDVGDYIDGWRVNMQAAFQLLALKAYTGEVPQGILVNVLEKPSEYKPRHTCKTCKTVNERKDWAATGAGYQCPNPSCGAIQALDLSDKSKASRSARYYRIMVTRSPGELEAATHDMERAALRMIDLRAGAEPTRATERCVDTIFGKCEYFEPHTQLRLAQGYQGFVQVEGLRYVGAEELQ